jgi:hypothetical protein
MQERPGSTPSPAAFYFQYPLKNIPQPPGKGIIPWFSGGFFCWVSQRTLRTATGAKGVIDKRYASAIGILHFRFSGGVLVSPRAL